jgi:hypothetical protein
MVGKPTGSTVKEEYVIGVNTGTLFYLTNVDSHFTYLDNLMVV